LAEESTRHVRRERLVGRLLSARVGVIEAGSGYGKSVLASQARDALGLAAAYAPLGPPDREPGVLISSLRRALRAANLSDLLAATEPAEPEPWVERFLDGLVDAGEGVILMLDDAHHLDGSPAAPLVLRLARGLTAPHRLLVAARGLTGALAELSQLDGAVHLDTAALAFTLDEAAALLDAQGASPLSDWQLRAWVQATQGWATALVVSAPYAGESTRTRPRARAS